MTPKLFKAADVCEMAQVQSYVLRSWEKEFPGIGVQKADGQRLYRQSDIDQVLRIKQLVFTEGLTLSGARRRLEESAPQPPTGVTAGRSQRSPGRAGVRRPDADCARASRSAVDSLAALERAGHAAWS